MGEELFWDFHSWFNYGKLSFTKFCSQMTEQYRTNHPAAAPFVSTRTFIQFFFSWVVRMGIDFRQEIDPWCQHDPDFLACDGTHVGVSLKLQNMKEPITSPELLDQKPTPLHQRNTRCFLPYPHPDQFQNKAEYDWVCQKFQNARSHLLLLSYRVLKDELEFDLVEHESVEEQNNYDLLDCLATNELQQVQSFVTMFINKTLPPSVIVAAAKLFRLMLKFDVALSVIFPFWHHTPLEECLAAIEASDPAISQHIQKVKLSGLEIAGLLEASVQTDTSAVVVPFVRELKTAVINLHKNDREVPPPHPIEGTYNPPSGIAYYFTEHGQKVREMPNYMVNDSEQDNTKSRRVDPCTKLYPQISTGGFGYIFLFFCPYHGHCYGFHLIDGGEGRKDPFSALLKYKPNPPKELFYDFACQFNEYCLNREPAFFKWVRVWHDLFHGCNHKCVPCFKSTRVLGLQGLNSEICEQFNSYLQSIKYTGSHLSQTHFMLFVQFMICLWNREKTVRVGQMAKVARAGLMRN